MNDHFSPGGFFGALFDFSFSEFIVTKVIKLLFLAGIVLAGIIAFAMVISGFSENVFAGLLMLILSPVVFILYVILFRIWLELIIVIFRIAENTRTLVDLERGRGKTSSVKPPPPPPASEPSPAPPPEPPPASQI